MSGKPTVRRIRSLPPLVEGNLHGLLTVIVDEIVWYRSSPGNVVAALSWWGEHNAVKLRPLNFKRNCTSSNKISDGSHVTYEIRTNFKLFESYLRDCETLDVKVVHEITGSVVGFASIPQLTEILLESPYRCYVPIVELGGSKVGDLHVAFRLEVAQNGNSPLALNPCVSKSGYSGQSASSSSSKGPQPLANYETQKPSRRQIRSRPQSDRSKLYIASRSSGALKERTSVQSSNETSTDGKKKAGIPNVIISDVIEKGQQLRNAMVKSVLEDNGDNLTSHDSGVDLLSVPQSTNGLIVGDSARSDHPRDVNQVFDYLLGKKMSPEEELQALGTLNDLSPVGSLLDMVLELNEGQDEVAKDIMVGDEVKEPESYKHADIFQDYSKHVEKVPDNFLARGDYMSSGERVNSSLKPSKMNSESLKRDEKDKILQDILDKVSYSRILIQEINFNREGMKRMSSGRSGSKKQPGPGATYFLEYEFPLSPVHRAATQSNSQSNVTKYCSRKQAGCTVYFNQQHIHTAVLRRKPMEKCMSAVLPFRVFSRHLNQRIPCLIGVAEFSMAKMLRSKSFSLAEEVPIFYITSNGDRCIGKLKFRIEFGSDKLHFGKDFVASLGVKVLMEEDDKPDSGRTENAVNVVPPLRMQSSNETDLKEVECVGMGQKKTGSDAKKCDGLTRNSEGDVQDMSPRSGNSEQVSSSRESASSTKVAFLHGLIYISQGLDFKYSEDFDPSPPAARAYSLYLVCRTFWKEDATKTAVCWITATPNFNFHEVVPVLLTPYFLEKIKENYMVIEVWNKAGGLVGDVLLGISKLPLHQFYVAYRDPFVTDQLLLSKYPVVAVDRWVPVGNPVTREEVGRLKILLAMGSEKQIHLLEVARGLRDIVMYEEPCVGCESSRFKSSTEATLEDAYIPELTEEVRQEYASRNGYVSHEFEFSIERIYNFPLFGQMALGEADCYIEYNFPESDGSKFPVEQMLKQFTSDSTVCVHDPWFKFSNSHTIILPVGVSLPGQLSRVFGNDGGIVFSVWCRYYYPSVQDKIVAKALLPISRLCDELICKERSKDLCQIFNIALIPVISVEDSGMPVIDDHGHIKIKISYGSSVASSCEYGDAAVTNDNELLISGTVREDRDKETLRTERETQTESLNLESAVEYSAEKAVELKCQESQTDFQNWQSSGKNDEDNSRTSAEFSQQLLSCSSQELADHDSRSEPDTNSKSAVESSNSRSKVRFQRLPQDLSGSEKETGDTFRAHVEVESALHLASVWDKPSQAMVLPSTYVSFQNFPSENLATTTPLVPNSSDPYWGWHCDVKLAVDLLTNSTRRLIFKIWRKMDGSITPNPVSDSVLGFAAVDVSVLLAGMPYISGWYNIMDFSGRCNGQIKISVAPLENVMRFKRKSIGETNNIREKDGMDVVLGRYESLPSHRSACPQVLRHCFPCQPSGDLKEASVKRKDALCEKCSVTNSKRRNYHAKRRRSVKCRVEHGVQGHKKQHSSLGSPDVKTENERLDSYCRQGISSTVAEENEPIISPNYSEILRQKLSELDEITNRLKQKCQATNKLTCDEPASSALLREPYCSESYESVKKTVSLARSASLRPNSAASCHSDNNDHQGIIEEVQERDTNSSPMAGYSEISNYINNSFSFLKNTPSSSELSDTSDTWNRYSHNMQSSPNEECETLLKELHLSLPASSNTSDPSDRFLLDELETDRLAASELEGCDNWKGKVTGLESTLHALRSKIGIAVQDEKLGYPGDTIEKPDDSPEFIGTALDTVRFAEGKDSSQDVLPSTGSASLQEAFDVPRQAPEGGNPVEEPGPKSDENAQGDCPKHTLFRQGASPKGHRLAPRIFHSLQVNNRMEGGDSLEVGNTSVRQVDNEQNNHLQNEDIQRITKIFNSKVTDS